MKSDEDESYSRLSLFSLSGIKQAESEEKGVWGKTTGDHEMSHKRRRRNQRQTVVINDPAAVTS